MRNGLIVFAQRIGFAAVLLVVGLVLRNLFGVDETGLAVGLVIAGTIVFVLFEVIERRVRRNSSDPDGPSDGSGLDAD